MPKKMKPGSRLVVLLPDSVRNYMSKFLNDGWMVENGFMEEPLDAPSSEWWCSRTVAELKLRTPCTLSSEATCTSAIKIMGDEGYDQLPVVTADGVQGMVTMGTLASLITRGRVKPDDPVGKSMFRQFKQIGLQTTLGTLSKIFDKDHFVLVVHTNRHFGKDQTQGEKSVVFGVVTRVDLLDYIVRNDPSSSQTTKKHQRDEEQNGPSKRTKS